MLLRVTAFDITTISSHGVIHPAAVDGAVRSVSSCGTVKAAQSGVCVHNSDRFCRQPSLTLEQ